MRVDVGGTVSIRLEEHRLPVGRPDRAVILVRRGCQEDGRSTGERFVDDLGLSGEIGEPHRHRQLTVIRRK